MHLDVTNVRMHLDVTCKKMHLYANIHLDEQAFVIKHIHYMQYIFRIIKENVDLWISRPIRSLENFVYHRHYERKKQRMEVAPQPYNSR